MGKCGGKACRLISMLAMTFSFFLVELIVGYATSSLALVADSFHMLSDVVALVVGLLSVRYSKKGQSKNNTFGWARAEVLGAMVNAVFLVALCFTIFVEAVQRMVEPEGITNPTLLLIVGALGLGINLIGLALFHNQAHGHSHGGMSHSHGHSHGGGGKKKEKGHGHSHGNDGHSHDHEQKPLKEADSLADLDQHHAHDSDNEISLGAVVQKDGSVKDVTHTKDPKQASAQQLNMKGVFLHVLGDALGSVVVVISAVIYLTVPKICPDNIPTITTTVTSLMSANGTHNATSCAVEMISPNWINFVDPALSLILVAIILTTSIPLVKDSGMILMQTVPTHIVVSQMQSQLEKIDGVLAVHEFHVWSLAGDKIVASLHMNLRSLDDYVRVSNEVKNYFHDEGIHSVTIQPEFSNLHVKKAGRDCVLECGPEKECHPATCCEVKKKPGPNGTAAIGAAPEAQPMENESDLEFVTVVGSSSQGAPVRRTSGQQH